MATDAAADVVATTEEAGALEREPLLILDPLGRYLDGAGPEGAPLGTGPIGATPIGAGHSNVTFLLQRGERRLVLRRPPRGPLAPSTHDMVREARLLTALSAAGVRVPEVLAVCEDRTVIGAPFYLMAFLDGDVIEDALPAGFDPLSCGPAIADQLIDALVELHGIDPTHGELSGFGRPVGYLERQVRRFSGLLAEGSTRPLPDLDIVGAWLRANLPAHQDNAVVHGDYRLGNVMFARGAEPHIDALLDWEMATLGDPLADVGYLTATWAQAGDQPDPMLDLSEVTRGPGFPTRDDLAERYAQRSGRDLSELRFYQALALFKASIFLENSYSRYVAGSTDDPYFARLGEGIPRLAARARSLIES